MRDVKRRADRPTLLLRAIRTTGTDLARRRVRWARLRSTLTPASLAGNTSSSTITVTPAAGTLTLDYAPGHSGQATLTVRATDTRGLFIDTTFLVTILPPRTRWCTARSSTTTARSTGTVPQPTPATTTRSRRTSKLSSGVKRLRSTTTPATARASAGSRSTCGECRRRVLGHSGIRHSLLIRHSGFVIRHCHRLIRALPPPAVWSSSSRVIWLVSPRVLMSRAPWATPRLTQSCGGLPVSKP